MHLNKMDEKQMTAEDAARALATLPRYEESLTARAFGVTLIAFALGGTATSLAYAIATDWFVDQGMPWLLSFLWLPFIGTAGILSAIVWHTQALTLRRPEHEHRGSWALFIVFSLGYMAILGGLAWGESAGLFELGAAARNLVTLGIFTLGLATFFHQRHRAGRLIRPTVVAGIALLIAGPILTMLDLGATIGSLAGALIGLVAWVSAGVVTARMG